MTGVQTCALPIWDDCPFILANPVTQKPYRSFMTSWETARVKADLADVEIDDLRFVCHIENDNFARTSISQLKMITDEFSKNKTIAN